ncbi:hypothetical protein [Pelagicoccus sp. SDUM812003]|uniref:hypothetical protein n=1 Tax=Pelagicoccus sp. SDUM812003 TaxID=3041267 RepID=UPI00280ED8A6|nr:hypothetical protein [Pelagicoccus sp. SDUM812003]MDQ8203476.1 hypothetical protein [Pelagicoccus sp. SDUM812003]
MKVRAFGPGTIAIPEITASVLDTSVTIPYTPTSGNLADSVKFYDHTASGSEFEIEWQIKIGDSDWFNAKTTKHTVYLTRAQPKASGRQESLFYLGCKNADGQTTEAGMISEIWNEFTDWDVRKRGGSSGMTYWGDIPLGPDGKALEQCTNFDYLISEEDGTCEAWAQLFIEILRAQGTTSPKLAVITPKNVTNPDLNGQFLLIRNWTSNPSWQALDRIPAQSNTDSPASFDNHAIVKIGTTLYDPSYGRSFGSENAHENAAFAGFTYLNSSGTQVTATNASSVQQAQYDTVTYP